MLGGGGAGGGVGLFLSGMLSIRTGYPGMLSEGPGFKTDQARVNNSSKGCCICDRFQVYTCTIIK